MTDYILIQTTTDNDEWTTKLVKALLENKISADVQIARIDSHYWWNNSIQNKAESLLSIKTRAELIKKAEEVIKTCSEYEVPQIIAIPIIAGSLDYLDWIKENTSSYELKK